VADRAASAISPPADSHRPGRAPIATSRAELRAADEGPSVASADGPGALRRAESDCTGAMARAGAPAAPDGGNAGEMNDIARAINSLSS
jgi:hypothetical protein